MSVIQEFVEVLNEIKRVKSGISGSRIKKLTDIAVANVHSESQIIKEVLENVKSVPNSHKLGALYVLDSIAKAYKAEADKRGEVVLPNATEGTYASGLVKIGKSLKEAVDVTINGVPEEQKEKVMKLVEIWSKDGTFNKQIIAEIKGENPSSDNGSQSANPVDPSAILKNLASLAQGNNNLPTPPAPPAGLDMNAQQTAMLQILSQLQQSGQLPPMPQPPQQQLGFQPQYNDAPGRFSSNDTGFSQEEAFSKFRGNNRDTRGSMRDRDNGSYSRRGDRPRSRSPQRRDNGYGGNNFNARSNHRDPPVSRTGPGERNVPGTPHYRPRNYSIDPNLPAGSIKVLSRTIFIGGVPAHMSDQDLATVLRPYAEVQSVILNSERKHAFVKVYSRKEAEEVISSFTRNSNTMGLRTRWGVGFGPRDCCDYQHGISIIPIARLTDADKRWVTAAEWGGIGSENQIAPGYVMEEPDIEVGEGVSSKAISKKMPTDGSRNGPRSTKPGEPDDLYTDPLHQPQAPAFLQNTQGKPNMLAGLFGNQTAGGRPAPPPGLGGFSGIPQQQAPPPPPAAAAAANDASSQLANLMAMLQQKK